MDDPGGDTRESLLEELARREVKHTPAQVVSIVRDARGGIIFLERGNERSGLRHIIEEHGDDFARRDISEAQIPEVVMAAAARGRLVGQVGSGTNIRPIYEIEFQGRSQRIAVGLGSNGYVVTGHPAD